MSADLEDLLRQALHQRADGIVPNQPEWEDLLAPPAPGPPARRQRLWLVVATAAMAVLLPFLVVRYVTRISHVNVNGGPGSAGPEASTASLTSGPPDAPLPAGFVPASVTRISLRVEWVLGTSPCGAGRCSTLARSRDSGATWHSILVPGPLINPDSSGVSRVRFANANDGWLFGPEVWATHDGGTSWHQVTALGGPVTTLEAAAGTVWSLVGPSQGGATDGVSATVYAAPVATDDFKPVGPDAVVTSAGISLHGKVGFTATPDGTILALAAGGLDKRGEPCNVGSLAALAAAGDNDVVAVCAGDPGAGSSTKTLLLSHDGGRTWSTAGTAPRGGQVAGLGAASTHTFIVAAVSGAWYFYRTSDGGRTWTTVFTDSEAGAPITDLGFTDPSHGVAVLPSMPNPELLVSSDAGVTWKAQPFKP